MTIRASRRDHPLPRLRCPRLFKRASPSVVRGRGNRPLRDSRARGRGRRNLRRECGGAPGVRWSDPHARSRAGGDVTQHSCERGDDVRARARARGRDRPCTCTASSTHTGSISISGNWNGCHESGKMRRSSLSSPFITERMVVCVRSTSGATSSMACSRCWCLTATTSRSSGGGASACCGSSTATPPLVDRLCACPLMIQGVSRSVEARSPLATSSVSNCGALEKWCA